MLQSALMRNSLIERSLLSKVTYPEWLYGVKILKIRAIEYLTVNYTKCFLFHPNFCASISEYWAINSQSRKTNLTYSGSAAQLTHSSATWPADSLLIYKQPSWYNPRHVLSIWSPLQPADPLLCHVLSSWSSPQPRAAQLIQSSATWLPADSLLIHMQPSWYNPRHVLSSWSTPLPRAVQLIHSSSTCCPADPLLFHELSSWSTPLPRAVQLIHSSSTCCPADPLLFHVLNIWSTPHARAVQLIHSSSTCWTSDPLFSHVLNSWSTRPPRADQLTDPLTDRNSLLPPLNN